MSKTLSFLFQEFSRSDSRISYFLFRPRRRNKTHNLVMFFLFSLLSCTSHSFRTLSLLCTAPFFLHSYLQITYICALFGGLFDKSCQAPMINGSLLINRESGRYTLSFSLVLHRRFQLSFQPSYHTLAKTPESVDGHLKCPCDSGVIINDFKHITE